MRLIEKCGCGGSIELIWSEPTSRWDTYEAQRESERAKKELAIFRKAHKTCAASNQDTRDEA